MRVQVLEMPLEHMHMQRSEYSKRGSGNGVWLWITTLVHCKARKCDCILRYIIVDVVWSIFFFLEDVRCFDLGFLERRRIVNFRNFLQIANVTHQ